MTDRDTFAAAALTGLLACMKDETLEDVCSSAYGWADAMLRERGVPKETRAEVSYTNHDAAPAAKATADRYVRRTAADGDSDRTDKAAPRPSEGTGNTPMDVDELLSELHYIAGSEDSVPFDIRRTACEAEHAIDRFRARVNELQLSRAEIDAVQHVVEDGRFVDLGDYGLLRSLLVRLRPEWEAGPDPDSRVWETPRTPPPHATPPQGSVPGEGSVPDSRTENEPVAWAVRYRHADTGIVELCRTLADCRDRWSNRTTEYWRYEPLYRSPTLTADERQAVEECIKFAFPVTHPTAATLRKLLERLS